VWKGGGTFEVKSSHQLVRQQASDHGRKGQQLGETEGGRRDKPINCNVQLRQNGRQSKGHVPVLRKAKASGSWTQESGRSERHAPFERNQ
jgi:hypothetical protein